MRIFVVHIIFTGLIIGISLIGCQPHNSSEAKNGVLTFVNDTTNQLSIKKEEALGLLMDDLKEAMVKVPEAETETYVLSSKARITSFPCSNCHNGDLKKSKGDLKNAHWNISIVHASKEVMNCATCHNSNKPDKLKSLAGNAIDFDLSYQQCAQCHATQAKDWLGGAHGKRIRGWVEPRTVYNCVSCHDPHQPAILSRWPSRFNTVKDKE